MKLPILFALITILSLASCAKEPIVYVEVVHRCYGEVDAGATVITRAP